MGEHKIIKNTKKEYCVKCGNKNVQNKEICDCGSKNFIFGNKFSYKDKKIICDCGSNEFQMIFHCNRDSIHNQTYECVKCKNIINYQCYIDDK
jgi:mRNA-degrading endonuclease HigB of HigAB toxin-antitoxin module